MHSAQGAAHFVERNVLLHHAWIEASLKKLFLAPGASKKTALVVEQFRLDDERVFKSCFSKDHVWCVGALGDDAAYTTLNADIS